VHWWRSSVARFSKIQAATERPLREILTDANFSDLREVFNAHAAEPRIVALLSPS
jgi:hypothetical protein